MVLTLPAEEAVHSLKQAKELRLQADMMEREARGLVDIAFKETVAAARKSTVDEEPRIWAQFIAFTERFMTVLEEAPDSPILDSLTTFVQLYRTDAIERQAEAVKLAEWEKKPVNPALQALFPRT